MNITIMSGPERADSRSLLLGKGGRVAWARVDMVFVHWSPLSEEVGWIYRQDRPLIMCRVSTRGCWTFLTCPGVARHRLPRNLFQNLVTAQIFPPCLQLRDLLYLKEYHHLVPPPPLRPLLSSALLARLTYRHNLGPPMVQALILALASPMRSATLTPKHLRMTGNLKHIHSTTRHLIGCVCNERIEQILYVMLSRQDKVFTLLFFLRFRDLTSTDYRGAEAIRLSLMVSSSRLYQSRTYLCGSRCLVYWKSKSNPFFLVFRNRCVRVVMNGKANLVRNGPILTSRHISL